jgi:glyoxylase-like metal-dependent hydrolase (beta-lactamase superfamily II)
MKALHRPDLFCWSRFDESRDVDFHSTVLVRPQGTIVVDPLPVSEHDLAHLRKLGPVRQIVITNSDHVRASEELALQTGASLCAPAAEREILEKLPVQRWLREGDLVADGVVALALEGSKTPGELALWVDGRVLVTGDLVRAHRAGSLMLLPDAKLTDKAAAVRSLQRLVELRQVEAVLVGDGWQVFSQGQALLEELLRAQGAASTVT